LQRLRRVALGCGLLRRARGPWAGRKARLLRGERGVTTVEFALIMPVFFTILMVGLQISMILVQYYSITHVARATARWSGINPDNTDSTIVSYAQTTASNNLPLVGSTGISGVTVSPSCTTLVSGVCSNRPSGEPITVTVTPNVSRAIFLPTTFRLPGIQVAIPTTMPAYRVTVLIE
jgi:Flp pilus assembly protein TadG